MKLLEVGILVLFVCVICFVFIKTLTYTMPFVVGLFIAILLQPLTAFFERKGASRPMAILTSMAIFIGTITATLGYIVVRIAQEAAFLSQNIPNYSEVWGGWLLKTVSKMESLYGQLPPKVTDTIQSNVSHLVDRIRDLLTSFFTDMLHIITGLPDSVVIIFIGFLAAYFFLQRKEKLIGTMTFLLPPGWDEKVLSIVTDVNRAFLGLLRAQVILIVLGIVISVFGLLIMNVHYAVTLGLLIGVAGLVPLVGNAIVTIPWAGFAFITGNIALGLKLLILQAFITFIRHLIEPKILANSVGLDILSTLFAMYVGLKLFGVFGLFIGPLFVIGLKSLFQARMFIDFLPDERNKWE